LETIELIDDPSSGKRIKTRVVAENLGHKQIDGLTAFGWRTSMKPLEDAAPPSALEYTSEMWKSSELNLTLLKVTTGPMYGSQRMELTDLKREAPDPALFETPQNYTIESINYRQVPCAQK
jgi:hypothetical protein